MEVDTNGDGNKQGTEASLEGNDREEADNMDVDGGSADDRLTATNQASNNRRIMSQAVNGMTHEAFANQDYRLQNLFWYDVKITVEEYPKKPTQALLLAAMNVFAVLKKLDNKVELHPYLETNVTNYNPIYEVNEFPTSNETEFKAYFLRCMAKDKGGVHYASILLGHNVDYKDMMASRGYCLRNIGAGLCMQDCQAELLKTAFYLLYSLREWEIPNFQRHLLNLIMEHPLAKKCLLVPPGIMCRWRVVPTGERGPMAEDNKVRAIGIDVEVGEYNVVKEIITQLYAVGTTNFPGGLKARALPDPWMITNAVTKERFGYLRNRRIVPSAIV